MDEFWRINTEMPPRRSTDYTTAFHFRPTMSDDLLSPEDFADVFGGPPRTILSHQFPARGCFYEDIFWQSEKAAPAVRRRGRNLPEFRIPAGKQSNSDRHHRNVFAGEIFGWDSERVVTSGSMSKTSSSSALSSEELSPLRPAVSDDGYDDVSLFASKLRAMNVKSKWDSTRMRHEDHQKWPAFSDSNHNFLETLQNYPFRKNEFPENKSLKVSSDDLQFNSPASIVTSRSGSDKDEAMEVDEDEDEDEDDDDLMSSYVIEINSSYRETECQSNGVDEAIAWAKETLKKHCPEEKQEMINEHHLPEVPTMKEAKEETNKIELEMQLLDAKIGLWSSGKETDIRLLLSTLHHILWHNSGWLPVSTMNLIESAQVKKSYQKAVLCLHPDKLQQRGATAPEKYIANKAFSALQDAWAAFISLDVYCR